VETRAEQELADRDTGLIPSTLEPAGMPSDDISLSFAVDVV
jgi:hypothetical protein